jgi:hypothetical protein
METHVAYKIKPEPLSRQHRGKWSLTLVKQVFSGPTLTEQPFYFDRLFDSPEAAEDYGRLWISARG